MGRGFGRVGCFGIEGTGSWGAGLTRWLAANGQAVVEVPRPDRARRRRKDKSDTLDAEAAARAALVGLDVGIPKRQDGPVEMIRALRVGHLCGAAPLPASSGKTTRHHFNPGGHRDANEALWRIVLVRMKSHAPTRAYAARRTAEGLSKREIMRCLKRYVAREGLPLPQAHRRVLLVGRVCNVTPVTAARSLRWPP